MPSPAVQVTSLLIQLARESRTALDQRFGALGLTSQQAGLLVHVFTGASSPRELADLLGTDAAGITRLTDRLAAKGLVTRTPDPRDRRSVVVSLTAEANALVPHLPPVFEAAAAELTRGLDARALVGALRSMQTNLRGANGL